ncbi:MAG: MATE family efflux transporter [Spirochaetia bacterium]|nr:MATE family efflux transporter [Spirochaetia bacterium]
MQSKNNQIDMTEGPILSKLLKFSIPLVFSSILQLLFNAADVVVVGRFAGDNSLAAVGSTGPLINLLIGLFLGLSTGTNVVAAHYIGSGKKDELSNTIHTSMLLSVFSGIFLTVVGVIFTKPILRLMKSPDEVIDLSAIYLRIYFGGITASMVYNFGSALLRARGDTKRPLFILLFSGIINVILNLIFVIIFHMNVAGVALATIISQTVSAVIVVIILLKEKDDFLFDLKKLKIHPHILGKIIRIGVPAGFQGMMFSFSNMVIQSSINSFGPICVAGNSAGQNLEGFVYLSMNGFSQGNLTFCSQNFGAKKMDRVKKVTIISQLLILVVGFALGFTALAFVRPLLSIYTTNPKIIEVGVQRLTIIFSTYTLCGIQDCMANSIRGCGKSLKPAIVTIFGICILRLVWISIMFNIPEYHVPLTVYLSYPISWIITWIILTVIFIRLYKNLNKNNNQITA